MARQVREFVTSGQFLSGALAGGIVLNHELILQLVALLLKIFVPTS